MSAHVERSKLINAYKSQLRALEKSLNKGKLPESKKTALRAEVEQLTATHIASLAQFDKQHCIESHHKVKATDQTPESATNKAPAAAAAAEECEQLQYANMTVADLRLQCKAHGMSFAGNREKLLTRLYAQVPEPVVLTEETELTKETKRATLQAELLPLNLSGAKPVDAFAEKRKKLWKSNRKKTEFADVNELLTAQILRRDVRRGAAEAGASEIADEVVDNSSGSESDSDGSSAASGAAARVPAASKCADAAEETSYGLRRDVVTKILLKVLLKSKRGVELDELPAIFEKMKVLNFSPEMLGFRSLEAWAESLPSHLVAFDKTFNTLYHASHEAAPRAPVESSEESN